MTKGSAHGFTLIELSIVLVIIGLIVGGVLVGQTLISAAAVRAQISQIEKYNSAANTFYGKYGYLPGDLPSGLAAQSGFVPRAGTQARGDGNGLVEGINYSAPYSSTTDYLQTGETALFWVDLSMVNMIEGGFNAAVDAMPASNITPTSSPSLAQWLPAAKIGSSNYVSMFVYSSQATSQSINNNANPTNYFMVANVSLIDIAGNITVAPGITVAQAYSIDKKIDDGLPVTGNVQARWGTSGTTNFGNIYNPKPSSATTCFDNNNVGSALQNYSVQVNNGNGVNCALSFRLQAGD